MYVSESALKNAIRDTNTRSTLARTLLESIFTKDALYKCTLTGKMGARRDRRMLNQDAVNAIYTFVQEGDLIEEKPFARMPLSEIKHSLRQKLVEMKADKRFNESELQFLV